VLSVKLKRLDDWNAKRRQVATWYSEFLINSPVEPVQTAPGAIGNAHVQVIQVDNRDQVSSRLRADGIGTSLHYPVACHHQPALASADVPFLPVAERAARRILSLPMGPHLTQVDVSRVVDAINRALKEMCSMDKESAMEEAAE
jgi:dTDP-4-amino-4,6-dideoxygalactose transaminase